MLKKKKSTIKQIKSKKGTQITFPTNFNTEQIRMATIESIDFKAFNKTSDLRKYASNNPKKSISRKSTNQSIKPNVVLNSPNFNRLIRDFKQLKLIHQNSSKSPVSCKSKSTKKNGLKKISNQTFKSQTTTIKNQSCKLDKTLKKLQFTNLFRDELSQLPFSRLSSSSENRQKIQVAESIDEESINLLQLRKYCSTVSVSDKKSILPTIKYGNLSKQNQAAIKIQRLWKRFRTRKLIQRYIIDIKSRLSSRIYKQQESEVDQNLNQYVQNRQKMKLFTADLYSPESFDNREIQNLQNNQSKNTVAYVQEIENMKQEQLNKWNQIIDIIKSTNCNNPDQIQKLFSTITQKSQVNKKKLQTQNTNKKHQNPKPNGKALEDVSIQTQNRNQKHQYVKQNKHGPQYQLRSENSVESEEYNCRKYVNYLDYDVYPFEKDNLSGSSQRRLQQALKKSTISKKKQEILLNQLKNSNLPNNLGQNKLYCSNSLSSLRNRESQHEDLIKMNQFSQSRNNLTRINSQKIFRNSQQVKIQLKHQFLEENLGIVAREFLQYSNLDVQINEGLEPKNKVEQNQKFRRLQYNRIYEEGQKLQQQSEEQEHERSFQRSKPSFKFYQQLKQDDEVTFFKIHSVKNEEVKDDQQDQIRFLEQQLIVDNQSDYKKLMEKEQQIDQLSIVLFNNLILQTLKDIARQDSLATSFKKYSQMVRSKSRKGDLGRKKHGFPTDKKQIQSFLQNMINYLKAYQGGVFKNLQVPTGPSALQMLRYMHQSQLEQQAYTDDEEYQANIMVIPNKIFDIFWQLKEKSIVVETTSPNSQDNVYKQKVEYLKNLNKIFYRSLFDTFNECLDAFRNFGQYGSPFPWKQTPAFQHTYSQPKIQSCISLSRKKMMDIATTYCGLIIQKEQMGDLGGNEQYVTQVQQDRLSRMLANDLIECDSKWVFYDDQEAEMLIELSKMIYNQIFFEIVEDLYRLL